MTGVLSALVDEFGEEHPNLKVPGYARERCNEASWEFVYFLRNRGIEAEVVDGVRMGKVDESLRVPLILGGHFAVNIAGTVYDWTARQFRPDAEVPEIMTLAEWRKTWRDIGDEEFYADVEKDSPGPGLD